MVAVSLCRFFSVGSFPCRYLHAVSWNSSLSLMSESLLRIWCANTFENESVDFERIESYSFHPENRRCLGAYDKLQKFILFPYKSRGLFLLVNKINWSSSSSVKLVFAQFKQVGVSQIHEPDGSCRIHILQMTALRLLSLHCCTRRTPDLIDLECGTSQSKTYASHAYLSIISSLPARPYEEIHVFNNLWKFFKNN